MNCRITFVLGALLHLSACSLAPDPWSPKTYRLELARYQRDTGALPASWQKFSVKGMEENSFFFAHDREEAVITVAFTCGKYRDIPLDMVAGHLAIPLGRKAEVRRGAFVRKFPREIYHLVAEGDYLYQQEGVYKKIGPLPDARARTVLDSYVIREPHCVVDLTLAASPGAYPAALPDFERFVASVGAPLDTEYGARP